MEGLRQNSNVREVERMPYNTIAQNYSNATDPVTVTGTGPDFTRPGGNAALAAQVQAALSAAGAAVPQVGQVACRSALTATSWGTTTNPLTGITSVLPGGLNPGCQPLNLFGEGVASQAALNYIAPGRVNPADIDRGFWYMGQSVIDVSSARPVALGIAGREDRGRDRLFVSPRTTDRQAGSAPDRFQRRLSSGNFSQWAGHYYVNEGFLEVDAPLLKNSVVESLDLNTAGRITDYSTSGMVETWKLGLVCQVNGDIRLRGHALRYPRARPVRTLHTCSRPDTAPLPPPTVRSIRYMPPIRAIQT